MTKDDIMHIPDRREDDKFLRKLLITIAGAIVVQALGWIYLLGGLANQVDNNTQKIAEIVGVNERLIRIETKIETTTETMQDIKLQIRQMRQQK